MRAMPFDMVPKSLPIVAYRGRIDRCPHAGCAFRCCEFQQGNFIALYPGELEDARTAGHGVGHLEMLGADRHGGHRVRCVARDTSSCDGGYKPLDCASYPLFPSGLDDSGQVTTLIKGQKCPLSVEDFPSHMAWVREAWAQLGHEEPRVASWLRDVGMIGYVPLTPAAEVDGE